nr:MAG TPA: hypothetical protein [Caudoviricetes sp.]
MKKPLCSQEALCIKREHFCIYFLQKFPSHILLY